MSTDAAPTAATSAVDRENPWPGLGSYDESMHAFFFGRDAEVEELLRLVRRDPVALFYGQSGLGKSSLLQAGLFPRLRAVDLMPVHIRLRYGAGFPHPVQQILQEVAAAARRAGGEAPAAPEGVSLFEYFYDESHEFWSSRNRVLTPVIVLDQFEEIFTLGARDAAAIAHRDGLLAQLADLAARRAPHELVARFEAHPDLALRYGIDRTRCRLLFSLREDFLPELGSLREHLPTLASDGLRLQRLRGHQAREVLEKPGAHLLEPGTTERIIRFVAAERAAGGTHELSELEVEPALLNVVARELNARRRARGLERISADLVHGARNEILADFYERAFSGLEPHVRAFVEDQLLTTTGFRDSVAVEDAEASYRVSRDTLAALVDRRLLRIDERFQMQRVELTHDLLTGVVKASRDSRREREAVAAERQRAEEARRAAEQAAADAQARLRHTRARALVIIAMGALAVGIGGLAYVNHRKAAEARRLDAEKQAAIEARMAADVAREEARTNLQRANLAIGNSLLLQADAALAGGALDSAQLLLRMGDDHGIFARESLAWFASALSQDRVLALEACVRMPEPTTMVDFAPDGRLIAVTATGYVRVAAPGDSSAPAGALAFQALPGALGELRDATSVEVLWDPRPLVCVGTRTRAVLIFDLTTGARVRSLSVPRPDTDEETTGGGSAKADATEAAAVVGAAAGDAVECARFSPDGRGIAAYTSDGQVTVWLQAGTTEWIPRPDAPVTENEFNVLTTETGRLDSDPPEPVFTQIAWALDGSLVVTTARATAWFVRVSEAWGSKLPIERYTMSALRSAVRPSSDGRASEWFVANSVDSRLHWLRLPPDADEDSAASQVRTSQTLADTVHSIAVMPGADVVFVATRNGAITTCRSDLTTSPVSMTVLQTTAIARARHIALRLRPDGRFLAATTDDGTIYLYRVSIPAALASAVPDAGDLVRDGDGWARWHADTGELTRADDSRITAAATFDSVGHRTLAVHLPAGAPTDGPLVFARDIHPEEEPDVEHCGVMGLESGEILWHMPIAALGRTTGEALAAVQFSPDGAVVAVPTADGRILRFDTRTGAAAGAPLEFAGESLRLAWSADGRRLAAFNNLQEVAIFEPAASTRPVQTLHARHSQLNGFALDETGHTLAYATSDARLVLERIAPGERRAGISVPLPAPATSIGLRGPAESRLPGITAMILGVPRTYSGSLPSETDLEWANLASVDGYETTLFTVPSSGRNRLSAAWTDDSLSTTSARLLRDTFAWIGKAASQFSDDRVSGATPDDLERLRSEGQDLRRRFDELASQQPAIAAFRDRLGAATADVVAFSTELAPGLTPLQRWPIVAYQHSIAPDSDVATTFAVEHAFPALVKMLEDRGSDTSAFEPELAAQYRQIVALTTQRSSADEAVWKARTLLRDHLYADEAWVSMILASPSAFLIDREANTQAVQENRETSNRLYGELERREPEALTYPIRRAHNLRRMGRIDEALAIFNRVVEAAAAAKNGEVEAEARVYRAWTYQEMEGRLGDAHTDMVAAATLADFDPWTLRNAIEFLISRGWPADGVVPAARLVEVDDTPAHRQLQARVHLALGDGAAARASVEPLAGSSDIAMRLDVVDLFGREPDHANRAFAAEWAYAAYRETSDTSLEDRALRKLGPLWLSVDDLGRARNAIDKLLDEYKISIEDQALMRALQGRSDLLRRDVRRGRESYDLAFRLDPLPAAWVRRDYAHFLEWTGDTTRALAEFGLAASKGDAEESLAHVLALGRLVGREAAVQALDAALERFPDDRPLRLARARDLLTVDREAAVVQLQALDDGSDDITALTAAALLNRATEAARRNLPRLANSYGRDHVDQAVLHLLAHEQTGESGQRIAALRELSTALDRGFRGDVRLLSLPGFESVRDDPLFGLADTVLATEEGSRASLFALARFNLRVAALITHQETKSMLLARAGAAMRRGVEIGEFTPADVLADEELAPFAAQF